MKLSNARSATEANPLGGSENWQSWCRLCANKELQSNVKLFAKHEYPQSLVHIGGETGGTCQDASLAAAIKKHFSVNILGDEELPQVLCTGCLKMITSLIKFTDRVSKVQRMFEDLQDSAGNTQFELHAMRLKYDMLEDFEEHASLLQDQSVAEESCFESKPNVDQLEALDTDTVESNSTEQSFVETEGGITKVVKLEDDFNNYEEFLNDSVDYEDYEPPQKINKVNQVLDNYNDEQGNFVEPPRKQLRKQELQSTKQRCTQGVNYVKNSSRHGLGLNTSETDIGDVERPRKQQKQEDIPAHSVCCNNTNAIVDLLAYNKQILATLNKTRAEVEELRAEMAKLGGVERDIKKCPVTLDQFIKIDNVEHLKAFEAALKDAQLRQTYFNQLKDVCNATNTELDELDTCYVLVDAIFSRKFFTLVTWTGSCRIGFKEPLRTYVRTISFFASLVRVRHPEFSEISCINFFKKKAIYNSVRRAEIEPQRISRKKIRKPTITQIPDYEVLGDECYDIVRI